MAPKLQPESTQQVTDQSNSQKPNSKQNSSGTITENLQTDLQQHNNTSALKKQNINELLTATQAQNEILQKKHKLISLLTENEALKEASQVRQLPQAGAALITSYINQETNTFASVIKEINAFNILKSEQLPEYYENNLREHSNFFHSIDTLFNMNTSYFFTERLKIYFVIQYLRGEPQDM